MDTTQLVVDIILIVLGALCLLVSYVGCFLPVIPGVVLAYIGILLLHFTERGHFSWPVLVILGLIIAFDQILDYIIPAWGTKKLGGTKWGARGSFIGIIVGLIFSSILGAFLGFIGKAIVSLICVFLGPFCGAIIGEILYQRKYPELLPPDISKGRKIWKAIVAGIGSFLGTALGIILKLSACIIMTAFFIWEVLDICGLWDLIRSWFN